MSVSSRASSPLLLRLILAACMPVGNGGFAALEIRRAAPSEVPLVAALQLDTFAPPPEPPALLPLLAQMYEANQRASRENMLQRLAHDLDVRVARGSSLLIAFEAPSDGSGSQAAAAAAAGVGAGERVASVSAAEVSTVLSSEAAGLVDASGRYTEPGPPLLGTVDLSSGELGLPTHALAGGLYISHMAVAADARRRGVARALLRGCAALAHERNEEHLYLHVEPSNAPAIALYESEGFSRLPDGPPYAGFTRALHLQKRAVLMGSVLEAHGA